VINCMLHLPHFNYWAPQSVASFLFGAKTLNLRMVTLVEEEMGDVCKGDFLNQFVDTLHHYSAVYDSLETGSPMQSRTRAFWWSSPLPWQWGGRELLLGGVHFSSNPALQISLSLSLSPFFPSLMIIITVGSAFFFQSCSTNISLSFSFPSLMIIITVFFSLFLQLPWSLQMMWTQASSGWI
jgi:hypothetical protein